jgi:hypothetical protein
MQVQLLQSISAPLFKLAYLEKKTPMVLRLNTFCTKNTNLQWCTAFQEDIECCDTDKENNHIPVEEGILLPAEK